jgi:hypothetical protein
MTGLPPEIYALHDRLTRKDRVAINCFHAMANLEELYPNGGFLGTGLGCGASMAPPEF